MTFAILYNIADFKSIRSGSKPDLSVLDGEIRAAGISSKPYRGVEWQGTTKVEVIFDDTDNIIRNASAYYDNRLSTTDTAILNEVIANHGKIAKVLGDISTFSNIFSEFPNVRMGQGITNRAQQIMTWRLPNGSSVQMYINPENFSVSESKQITQTRTKGGYVVQYWGDNLTKITMNGTTGSSGVKGIQVLRDIYRAENHAFELVAATQLENLIDLAVEGNSNDDSISKKVFNASNAIRERSFILRPTLASLALSVMLFYQGIQYKGFFTEFTMTENISKLGLFDYNIAFTATEIRGSRNNFMPWHKEPLANDLSGQLVSGTINTVGNALRSLAGLPQQSQNPEQLHPENAPLSFGGPSSVSGILGLL